MRVEVIFHYSFQKNSFEKPHQCNNENFENPCHGCKLPHNENSVVLQKSTYMQVEIAI